MPLKNKTLRFLLSLPILEGVTGLTLYLLLWSLFMSTIFRFFYTTELRWSYYPFLALFGILLLIERRKTYLNPVVFLIFIFGAIALYSTPFKTETLTVSTFAASFTIFIFLVVLPELLSTKQFGFIFKSLIGIVSAVSLICLIIYALKISEIGDFPLLFAGLRKENFIRYCIYESRIIAAQSTQWVPALAVFLLASEKSKWSRFSLVTAIPISIVHLMFTLSRSGQLVLLISLFPLIRVGIKKTPRHAIIGAGIAIALFLTILFFEPFAATKYFSVEYFPIHRPVGWWIAIQHVWENSPICGVGLLQYWPRGSNVHNSFISILLYFGILGLLVFLAILILTFHSFYKHIEFIRSNLEAQLIFFLLVALLVEALFEDTLALPLLFSQVLFCFICGFYQKWLIVNNNLPPP